MNDEHLDLLARNILSFDRYYLSDAVLRVYDVLSSREGC
ncbi:hypothetical protein BRAS3809_7910003 [Bradyrhizobium sp. STM 3809]|nr:hypothetical protein BRAS3809_7910003 [Bradyrhizobium sp. STM 3809]